MGNILKRYLSFLFVFIYTLTSNAAYLDQLDILINGATPSVSNTMPSRLSDGLNYHGIFLNSTNAQFTVSSPSYISIDGNLTLGWDGTVHREFSIDTSGRLNVNLASGAATAANQSTANTSLASMTTAIGSQTDTAATTDTGTFSLIALFKRLLQSTTTTNTNQTNGSQKSQTVDASGNVQPVGDVASRGMFVRFSDGTNAGGVFQSVAASQFTLGVPGLLPGFYSINMGWDGTNHRELNLDSSGRLNINNITGTVSLPTGAATETTLGNLRTDNNTNLGNIKTSIDSTQAASGAAVPANVELTGGRNDSGIAKAHKVDDNGSGRMVIVNPNDSTKFASISNGNRMRVTIEPSTQANDKFDGVALDTNIWTSSTCGTGVVSTGTGNLSLINGTTTSNCAYITTVDNAQAPGNASLQFGAAMKFETTTLATNTRRYWGFATGGGTYAQPLTDGVIYEIDESQNIRASIYQSGTRVFSQVLSASCALDGNFHRWDIFYNTMNIAWYIDCVGGQDRPVAQVTNGTNPAIQNLPARLAAFNNTAASPSLTPVMQSLAFAVTDTAHNGQWLVDGRYPTRRATIEKNFGGLKVSTKVGLTWSNGASATVTNASTTIAAANANRGGLIISNISNGIIFIWLNGGTAVANTGIPIYPGGNFQMDEGTFSNSAITGICSLSSCASTVQEGNLP